MVIQCYTLVSHLSPTCLHLCPTCLLLTCISHDVPGVPQQHPAAGTDSNSRGQNHTEPKYDKFQWARLSRNYWQWHHHKDCNQYHTGLSRIMSTIHCPQWWNSIQINSQSNKEKNYQNLNETLRARRCDTTSGHLVRRKPAVVVQKQSSSSLAVASGSNWATASNWAAV